MVTVCTAFIKIPTGINAGYLHFGDSMIYISGCILGPWALLASAIGGALADILAGSPQWAIATAIIKALNAVPFVIMAAEYKKKNNTVKVVNKYTSPMLIVSGRHSPLFRFLLFRLWVLRLYSLLSVRFLIRRIYKNIFDIDIKAGSVF